MNYLEFLREIRERYKTFARQGHLQHNLLCPKAYDTYYADLIDQPYLEKFKNDVQVFMGRDASIMKVVVDRLFPSRTGRDEFPGFSLATHNYRMRMMDIFEARERKLRHDLP